MMVWLLFARVLALLLDLTMGRRKREQVEDLEAGRFADYRGTSSASASPSPSKLKARVVIITAMPGKVLLHQPV